MSRHSPREIEHAVEQLAEAEVDGDADTVQAMIGYALDEERPVDGFVDVLEAIVRGDAPAQVDAGGADSAWWTRAELAAVLATGATVEVVSRSEAYALVEVTAPETPSESAQQAVEEARAGALELAGGDA